MPCTGPDFSRRGSSQRIQITPRLGAKSRITLITSTGNGSIFAPLKTVRPYPFMPMRTWSRGMIGDALRSTFAAARAASSGAAAARAAGISIRLKAKTERKMKRGAISR